MQFEQVPYEVKAHTTGAFGLFSRVLVLFFADTRRRTSAAATGRNSPRMSSKKESH
jgi:hypothetical protein